MLNPISFQKLGSPLVQSVFATASDALKASTALSTTKIDETLLHTCTVKLPDGSFAVQVTDFPESFGLDKAREIVLNVLSPIFPRQTVSVRPGSPKNLVFRLAPKLNKKSQDEIMEALKSTVLSTSEKVKVSTYSIKKPAIFIRQIAQTTSGTVTKLLTELGAVRVQEMNYRSEQVPGDLAIAYFNSEEAALLAMKKLKVVTLDGKKVHTTYKETSEPAFHISNLPLDASVEEVSRLLLQNYITPIDIKLVRKETTSGAVVILGYPKAVDVACNSFRKKVFLRGNLLSSSPMLLNDVAIEISVNSGSEKELLDLRDAVTESIKKLDDIASLTETKLISNVGAMISFASLNDANTAQAEYTAGNIELFPTSVGSKLVAFPSYTVEIDSFSPTEPASKLVDAIEKEKGIQIIGSSRSAILKFRRHRDVKPGVAKLSKCQIDGQYLKTIRYSPLNMENESEYDTHGFDEEWDRFHLKGVLQDFLHTDPATRFQVARNHFERAFKGAKIDGWLEYLVDDNSSAELKAEVTKEIAKPNPDMERLFEIFIQKQDMQKFTHDFKEMRSLLGKENPLDPFDWSEFRMDDAEDVKRLEEEMHRLDKMAGSGVGVSIKGGPFEKSSLEAKETVQRKETGVEGSENKVVHGLPEKSVDIDSLEGSKDLEDLKDIDDLEDPSNLLPDIKSVTVENDKTGETERISLENPEKLVDSDGHVWAGAILDTDMTQKTMPGNRIATHRVLVVVGNLKGAAGFGVGKGKNPQEAVNSAFRDALRNLLYVDLYDNFGLAHDLHGKHNSCHAYIRATPSSRIMVASPFAAAVLNRFGIYSASCKLIGRRNPYSMVRAIFNALEKHENIDETAKARGQRYLTLRWAYDKNV
jgi:small subunit ribosomal protein S5